MNELMTASYEKDRDYVSYDMSLPRSRGRFGPLLDLAVKLNSAFLMAHDLDEILQAVLVGVTVGEGLGFNRAFLFQLDTEKKYLEGKLAIGPASPEDAGRIWAEISKKQLSLFEILDDVKEAFYNGVQPLNQLVRQIKVPLLEKDHILVRAVNERRAFWVGDKSENGSVAPEDLVEILGAGEFAVAPLFAQEDAYGVILADNFVTGRPIDQGDVDALQLFAGLASIAVGKTRMCEMLEERVQALRTLNEEVERNKDQLVEAERYAALGRMADQLLHEIRNPLSTIGGMAKILKRKLKDTELANYAETMVKESERVEKTLTAIFDFANVPELNPELVRVCDLIKASLALLQSELDRHNITLNVDFPDLEPVLFLDRIYIQQAFLSILKNAVEAMPDGGMLTVSVSVPEGNVEIQITDTGLGMAKGHLNKADEPFFTTKTHGLGLGLSLAKRVIELHGGFMCLIRNKLGGTNVSITLPDVSA
ncbi:MAG: two-component system sensor histidine kinase/response regulator [Deltaproteobacteria bacterium]|nr:two-component system sensor histidine kinase/response regulator [Deltaproteobacteria bacterium]